MIISEKLLDSITEEAKQSPRLRKNFNLHESLDSKVQRNELGTAISIQRHQNTAETIMLVRGGIKVILLEDNKNIIEVSILSYETKNCGIHIPAGVWHSVEVLESSTMIFEVKEGPYASLSDEDIME